MKISKLCGLVAVLTFASFAHSQTLPPPPFAGQSYWYGPGPTPYALDATSQSGGGFAEQSFNGSVWQAVGGGPAFQGNSVAGPNIRSLFQENADVYIEPYIYVDGYFAVNASILGYSNATLDLGSSKFYILHNTTIDLRAESFTKMGFGQVGVNPLLDTTYVITYQSYVNPANFQNTVSILGNSGTVLDSTIDVGEDLGLLEVQIARSVTTQTFMPSGTYRGIGIIRVTSV